MVNECSSLSTGIPAVVVAGVGRLSVMVFPFGRGETGWLADELVSDTKCYWSKSGTVYRLRSRISATHSVRRPMLLCISVPLVGPWQRHPLQTVLSSDSPCATTHSMTQCRSTQETQQRPRHP